MIKGWGRAYNHQRDHWIDTSGRAVCGRYIGYHAIPEHADGRNRCANCERKLAEQRTDVEMALNTLQPQTKVFDGGCYIDSGV